MDSTTMTGDEVVISGISGKFPNCDNIRELQKCLMNKEDCVNDDKSRWNIENPKIPQRTGKIKNIDKFDNIFFGIHAKLADQLEPMTRMMLECTYEAIVDAGINPRELKEGRTMVVMACGLSESEKSLFYQRDEYLGFQIIGTSRAMVANRVSFFYGLTGSSLAVDSGCNAGGTALELAYEAIKEGRCDNAIVGSSYISLHPHVSLQMFKAGILSPDGITRSFDNKADGCARSEAVVSLFLQRARDAKRIYTEIVGVKSSHGPAIDKTILIPTSKSQEMVMRDTLDECGLSPEEITFVEADGKAIKEIDAQEANALDSVYNKSRNSPLLIGSVKANLGNTFQSSTLTSIVKVITAMESGLIPPNINYEKPSEEISALAKGRLKVVTDLTPWDGEYAAVNTASLTGNCTHIILKGFTKKKKNGGQPEDDLPRLVIASGRTKAAVETILDDVESRPIDVEMLQLLYDVHEMDVPSHLYRGFTVLLPQRSLQSKRQEIQYCDKEKNDIWYVFSGMGSQWVGMGKSLMRIPIFAESVKKCDAVLKPQGIDIIHILTSKDPKMFDNIIHSFVGIATVQVGLVNILKEIGIEPDHIIGHSAGELGCAYADECFTAEQTVLAALFRGRASLETELLTGAMLAVGLGYEAVEPLCPPDIDVACHNSSNSATISGPAESVKKFTEELKSKGIFAKEVATSNIAYHSRYIAPAGPKLLKYLRQVIPEPKPRSNRWISSSIPQSKWNTDLARFSSPEYHTNNLLSSVLFAETLSMIPSNAVLIEIGPHGLLQAILKKSLPETCTNITLTKKDQEDGIDFLMTALGKLYNVGLQPKLTKLYPKVEYPVGRGTPTISSLIKWDHSSDWFTSFYQVSDENVNGEKIFEINLAEDSWKFSEGHRINGKIVLSISMCLKLVWTIWKMIKNSEDQPVVFEEVKIYQQQVVLPKRKFFMLTVMVHKGSGKFEASNNEILIASGVIRSTDSLVQERLNISPTESNDQDDLSESDVYTELKMRGFQYSGLFRSIRKASMNGLSGTLIWRNEWIAFLDGMMQMFVLGNDVRQTQLPLSIQKIVIDVNMHNNIINNSQELPITVDHRLNIVNCGGVQILGITLETVLPDPETRKSNIEGLNVIPYIDETIMKLPELLQIVLQLSTENCNEANVVRIIDEDSESQEDYHKILQEVAKKFKQHVQTVPISCLTNGKNEFKDTTLTILPDLNKKNESDLLKILDYGTFLLTFVDVKAVTDFTEKFESTGQAVVLKKKLSPDQFLLLFRRRKVVGKICVVEMSDEKYDWTKEVQEKLFYQNYDRIIVLNKTKDCMNYLEIVDLLQEISGKEKIRFFDIRDPKAPNFSSDDPLYQSQLQLDLLFNILEPGALWGSHRSVPVAPGLHNVPSWTAKQILQGEPDSIIWVEVPNLTETKNDRLIKIEFATLNSQDLREAIGKLPNGITERNIPEKEKFGSEFSGLNSEGTRLMGISEKGALSSSIIADPIYTWLVPESWSLEDAATVPLSYAVAYNALYLKSEIKKGDSILIVGGCSGFGQAAINLAISNNCEIFTTYANDDENEFLRSRYPTISEGNLCSANDSVLRHQILDRTGGEGVDIIIICTTTHSQILETAFTCARPNSSIVIIDDLEDFSHDSVGLEIFLEEISLYSICPKNITLANQKIKIELARMVKDGISSGVVKPLHRKVYPRELLKNAFVDGISKKHFGKILVKIQPDENLSKNQALAVPRVYCLNNTTYLIIEGLTDFGLELIDFLVVRGARNIVISSGTKSERGYCKLRLKLWRSYGVNLIIREDLDVSKKQNVKALIKEAASLGPIDAIFDLQRMRFSLVNLHEASRSMNIFTKFLDEESRQSCPELKKFIVCSSSKSLKDSMSESLLREARVARLCEKRCKDGLPGLLVLWSPIEELIPPQNLPIEQLGLEPIPQCVEQLNEIITLNLPIVLASRRSKENEMEQNIDDAECKESEETRFKEYIFKVDPLINYRYRNLEKC